MKRSEGTETPWAPITCPRCGGTCRVPAPMDACSFFHMCECCGAHLRAEPGDCCVICSYGEGTCPPRARA